MNNSIHEIDFYLDITSEVCPLTFVKTKLLIEKMQPGQVAEVRLKGVEPLENVPQSVHEYGHTVIRLKAEVPTLEATPGTDAVYQLLFRKKSK